MTLSSKSLKLYTVKLRFLAPFVPILALAQSPTEVVALTILGEARGEGKAGMTAVAQVIRQRSLNSGRSPDFICLQKFQFSCNNLGLDPRLRLDKSFPLAYSLAQNLNRLGPWCGATHYCTTNINPYWIQGKKPILVLGKHKFFAVK